MKNLRLRLQIATILTYLLILNVTLLGAVPEMINYQGFLENQNGNPLPNQDYVLTFRVYGSESEGVPIWGPQTFDGSGGTGAGALVPVVNGYFSLMLGPVDADGRSLSEIFDGQDRYVEIQVGDNVPIAPRQRILTAPYAFQAARASLSDTSLRSNVATVAEGIEIDSLVIDPNTGNVGVHTRDPSTALSVNGTVAATSFAGDGSQLTNLPVPKLPAPPVTTAPMTLYVNTASGSDDNDGLASITPKQTITSAVGTIPDRIEHAVTIMIAPGEYKEAVQIIGKLFVFHLGGRVILSGTGSSPGDVTISGNSGSISHGLAIERGRVTVQNIRFAGHSARSIYGAFHSHVNMKSCIFDGQAGVEITEYSAGTADDCKWDGQDKTSIAVGVSMFSRFLFVQDNEIKRYRIGVDLIHGGLLTDGGAGQQALAGVTFDDIQNMPINPRPAYRFSERLETP